MADDVISTLLSYTIMTKISAALLNHGENL
jgi:hypothetical protein